MSDYELIMIILEVMTVVIAFGALVALICLGKDKQPFVILKQLGHFITFVLIEMSLTDLLARLSSYIIKIIIYIVKFE